MPSSKATTYNKYRVFIPVKLLAEYFNVSRNTITRKLKEFRPDYDLHNLEDVLDFVLWYTGRKKWINK